jgi:hypothetical protein
MISLTTQTSHDLAITLNNGVELAFAIHQGKLNGLSQAIINGTSLIAPNCSRLPIVETRNGWQITEFRFIEQTQHDDQITLSSEAWGCKSGHGHKTDVFQVPYLTTPHRQCVRLGTFHWHITPRTLILGHPNFRELTYQGFDYHYEFELAHDFHWILDSGTWELGGDPQDIKLLSQRIHPPAGPLEFTISRQGRSYSTAESFIPKLRNHATTVPDVPSDPSMGFILPIQAQLRGAGGSLVDVQYKHDDILLCFFEQADYYRTLIEWRKDDPGIGHLDQHFFPLTNCYTTPAKTIVAARLKDLTHTQAINHWTDAWDHLARTWCTQTGVSQQEPIIGMGLDSCGAIGRHYGSGPADVLDRWEARFEWMQHAGMEYLFLGGLGNHRGHELPFGANMCQPYDYTIHERYGGPQRFKQFCKTAHEHGIKIALWICGHLSDWAPALLNNPDWTIQYDSGTPWDGGYRIMRSCSYRRGFSDWLLNQMRDLKEMGLDLLFFDSYHNLAAMPIDYSDPTLSPQIHDLWHFQAQCDQIGLPMLIESVGPIGLSSCGLWPQYLQSPELNYQSHMRCKVFDDRRESDLKSGLMNPALYFRMLANKAPIGFSILEQSNTPFEGLPDIPETYLQMIRLYKQIKPLMQIRTINKDGSIWWHDPKTNQGCLFAVNTRSITVPYGFEAAPIYNTQSTFSAGTHAFNGIAAFELIQQ